MCDEFKFMDSDSGNLGAAIGNGADAWGVRRRRRWGRSNSPQQCNDHSPGSCQHCLRTPNFDLGGVGKYLLGNFCRHRLWSGCDAAGSERPRHRSRNVYLFQCGLERTAKPELQHKHCSGGGQHC